ncbi:MAG: tetratricopeptide repeat protein [Bacteroidetes bacterium]|nr:MAG: tetratricopeptide repeat protein [Bacteroidota bacterium]
MKHAFSSLLVLLNSFFAFSQNAKIDSLLSVLKKESADSVVIKTRVELGRQFLLISEYDRAISYNNEAIRLAEQVLSSADISGNYRNSILKAQSKAYNSLGNVHYHKGEHDKSVENHLKALKIREAIGDKQGIGSSYNNIGNVLFQKKDLDRSIESYQKSIKIAEEINDRILMSTGYNNIGLVWLDKNDTDKAVVFLQKALKLREEIGDKQAIAASYNNIGMIYNVKGEYQKTAEYYFKALKIMEEVGDKMAMSVACNNIGDLYLKQHKAAEAKKMHLRSLALGEEINAKPSMLYAYASLARSDSALGDFKGAYEYQKLYGIVNDSIFNEESDKSMLEMQTKYDTEKKEHEIELLTKDGELQKTQMRVQQIVIGSIIAGLLLVIVFSVFIFNRLRITRKQKLIIEEQKIIVDLKNKHITDSINYAKRIQNSILPSPKELSGYFSDHFILFRPRDVVSGDFYWFSVIPESGKAILAIADCTGHGVPGAFMSMIGNTLLNEIVNEQKIFQPAEILNYLHEGIVKALRQESSLQDDGMDISVCLFDKKKNTITFSGANHSMYITGENAILEIKGDIYSIGSVFGQKKAVFSQKEVAVKKNSTLLFFSDGFPDQVGGEKGKKFLISRMESLFIRVSTLGIREQEQEITKAFDEWKDKRAQLDDVLLAGIKI